MKYSAFTRLALLCLSLANLSQLTFADSLTNNRSTSSVDNLGSDQAFLNTIQLIKDDKLNDASTILSDNPAFITAEDSDGNSLLAYAAMRGKVEIAKLLSSAPKGP